MGLWKEIGKFVGERPLLSAVFGVTGAYLVGQSYRAFKEDEGDFWPGVVLGQPRHQTYKGEHVPVNQRDRAEFFRRQRELEREAQQRHGSGGSSGSSGGSGQTTPPPPPNGNGHHDGGHDGAHDQDDSTSPLLGNINTSSGFWGTTSTSTTTSSSHMARLRNPDYEPEEMMHIPYQMHGAPPAIRRRIAHKTGDETLLPSSYRETMNRDIAPVIETSSLDGFSSHLAAAGWL